MMCALYCVSYAPCAVVHIVHQPPLEPPAHTPPPFAQLNLQESGFQASDLAEAGFKPSELIASGFPLRQLRTEQLFTVAELKRDKVAVDETKAAGYAATDLIGSKGSLGGSSGYSLREIVDGGFTPAVLREELGMSVKQLLQANISPAEIVQAGYSLAELKEGGCGDVTSLGVLMCRRPICSKQGSVCAPSLTAAFLSRRSSQACTSTPVNSRAAGSRTKRRGVRRTRTKSSTRPGTESQRRQRRVC